MTAKGFNRVADSYLFWLLLLLAILLRLYAVEYSAFRNDSVRDAMIAQKIAEGQTLIKGSATGWDDVYRGPIFYHYLSLFYRISPDPRILALSSILPNILALLVCFFFCKRFFSPTIARFATLMYSFSPIAIGMFNFILEVNLSPLILTLCLYFVFEIVFNGKTWGIVPLAFCMGLLWDNSQYYISTIVVAAALILPRIRTFGLVKIAVALLALILALTPYLLMDAANDFSNTTGMVKAILSNQSGDASHRGIINPSTYTQPIALILAPLVFALDKTLLFHYPVAFLLSIAQSLIFFVGLFAFAAVSYRVIRKRFKSPSPGHPSEMKILYLMCWFIAPIPMLMVFSQNPALRFYYCQYPINFLMIAMGAVILIGGRRSILNPEEPLEKRPKAKAIIWILMILLCLSQARLLGGASQSAMLDNLRIKDKIAVGQCVMDNGGRGKDLAHRVWLNQDDRHDPGGTLYGYEFILPHMSHPLDENKESSPLNFYAIILDDDISQVPGPVLCRINQSLGVFVFNDQVSLLFQMEQWGYKSLSLNELLANDEQILKPHFR